MNNKLYVGNLNYAATQQDLIDCFAQAGSVLEAILIMDRSTGNSRGFGFVTMETEEDARKAMSELNDTELLGRPLKIKVAFDRPDDGYRRRQGGHQHRPRYQSDRGRRGHGGGGHGYGRGRGGGGGGRGRGRGGHRDSGGYRH